MFKILSDLSLVLRKDIPVGDANNTVLASGVSGSWITYNTNGNAKLTTGTAVEMAWPVFNESRRDTTVGWTPDVTNSKKVTALCGKLFATTDQYTGVSAVGPLVTGANGKLVTATEGSATNVVAYCIKAPYSTNFHGTTITVIDIYTL